MPTFVNIANGGKLENGQNRALTHCVPLPDVAQPLQKVYLMFTFQRSKIKKGSEMPDTAKRAGQLARLPSPSSKYISNLFPISTMTLALDPGKVTRWRAGTGPIGITI